MVNWAIKSNIFHPNLSNKAMDDANELVKKIQAGDTNSFRKLIERYQRVVSHIVFRLIYQPKDREDICQDVFLQVYQNLANFKFESKLSTWIGQIAYHRCLNYLEKKRTPLYDDLAMIESPIETLPELGGQPDEAAVLGDLSARVQREIDHLPIQFRTILTLYHLEQMKYQEIAEVMQLPEGTVKSYLFRARKLLKQRLLNKYRREELI